MCQCLRRVYASGKDRDESRNRSETRANSGLWDFAELTPAAGENRIRGSAAAPQPVRAALPSRITAPRILFPTTFAWPICGHSADHETAPRTPTNQMNLALFFSFFALGTLPSSSAFVLPQRRKAKGAERMGALVCSTGRSTYPTRVPCAPPCARSGSSIPSICPMLCDKLEALVPVNAPSSACDIFKERLIKWMKVSLQLRC